MIEKNEDSNQSYKTAASGLPDSSNKTYSFYWGEYGTDQTDITDYDKVDGSNDFGFLKPEQDSYKGTPYLPDDVSSWTNGALSDWDGKANSNVLKGVTTGGQPLDTGYYWSSSEHSSNSGWIVLFNNGRTFTRYKRLTSSVRFVRDIE